MTAPLVHYCEGKTPYGSKGEALQTIKFIQRDHRRKPKGAHGPMKAYRCAHCHSWHIGRGKP